MKTQLLIIPLIGIMASCSHETTTKVLTLRNSGEVNKIDEAFILKDLEMTKNFAVSEIEQRFKNGLHYT